MKKTECSVQTFFVVEIIINETKQHPVYYALTVGDTNIFYFYKMYCKYFLKLDSFDKEGNISIKFEKKDGNVYIANRKVQFSTIHELKQTWQM